MAPLDARLVKSFASAAQVQIFKRVRESRQIKHLPIRLADGEVKYFHSIKEACPAIFGRTYESLLDAEGRYNLLGEEAYEAATRLHLNDGALRAARALPPEKLEVVRTAITSGSTKAETLSVIEDAVLHSALNAFFLCRRHGPSSRQQSR